MSRFVAGSVCAAFAGYGFYAAARDLAKDPKEAHDLADVDSKRLEGYERRFAEHLRRRGLRPAEYGL